jgi:hypothetical protein
VNGKTLLAALAGAIVMYVFASGFHMSPAAQVGVSQSKDDAAMIAAMKTATGDKAGMYHFPYMDMSSKDAMKTMTTALKTSPSGVLLYHPAGDTGISPTRLIGEFVVELVEVTLALWLLSMTTVSSFGGRVGFMAGVGLIAGITTNVSYMLWFNYPLDYTVVNVVYEVLKFVIAGAVAAWILGMKPKAAAATA